jgi:MraZ protein
MLKVRCQARVTVDVKGRLQLPAVLRKALQTSQVQSFVLTHHDGAIWGWTPEDFEARVEGPLDNRDAFDREVIDFARSLLGAASDVDIDAQGRIRIPQHLQEIAGLEKDAVVISLLHRIEVWDRTRWEETFKRSVDRVSTRSGMPPAQGTQ